MLYTVIYSCYSLIKWYYRMWFSPTFYYIYTFKLKVPSFFPPSLPPRIKHIRDALTISLNFPMKDNFRMPSRVKLFWVTAELLCCILKTSIRLYINYMSIKKKELSSLVIVNTWLCVQTNGKSHSFRYYKSRDK